MLAKAVPAEARVPKLIHGENGQVFIMDQRSEKDKPQTAARCFCDCCPDSDLEFPLRTYACCTIWWSFPFYIAFVSYWYGVDVHTPKHSLIQLRPDISRKNDPSYDYSGKWEDWRRGVLTSHRPPDWLRNPTTGITILIVHAVFWFIMLLFHCRVVCECFGSAASKKYIMFRIATILGAVLMVGELLLTWWHHIKGDAYPYDGWILVPISLSTFALLKIYSLLAAFKLVPPYPIVVEKAPLVVNVIQPEDQPLLDAA